MFGRKKSDDYDEYNESVNAKYDDDYIRDNKEYRDECSHSHEQTYKNYDSHKEQKEYREECEHSHEQTYEDFSEELKPYDELNELEKFFEPMLDDGEHILWCGEPEKKANSSETGIGCAGNTSCLMYLIAIPLFLLSPIVSIVLIVLASLMKSGSTLKGRKYAITNKRVITGGASKQCMVPLSTIGAVAFHSSSRNIGYVTFQVNPQFRPQKGNRTYNVINGLFAVKDPERVAGILKQAKEDYRNYQGSVNNG